MSVRSLPQGFLCETHTARESSMRAIARRVSMFLTTALALAAIVARSAAAQANGSGGEGGGGSIRGKVVSRADQHALPHPHVIVAGGQRTTSTPKSGGKRLSPGP